MEVDGVVLGISITIIGFFMMFVSERIRFYKPQFARTTELVNHIGFYVGIIGICIMFGSVIVSIIVGWL